MFARDAQFLELKSPSDEQFLEVTDLRFKVGHKGFNPFPYSTQKLWNSYFHCNSGNYQCLSIQIRKIMNLL